MLKTLDGLARQASSLNEKVMETVFEYDEDVQTLHDAIESDLEVALALVEDAKRALKVGDKKGMQTALRLVFKRLESGMERVADCYVMIDRLVEGHGLTGEEATIRDELHEFWEKSNAKMAGAKKALEAMGGAR